MALFLLICDLAVNPTRGLPIDVEVFERFIHDVDVGSRFTLLCKAVARLPHLKSTITACSKEEYISVSEELTALVGYDNPVVGPSAVRQWMEHAPGLPKLMQEYETFDYDLANFPIRVFLSHFVAFYRDKLEHPEFFCWAGMYMSRRRLLEDSHSLWLRHLSLFSDRGDRHGIFPRKWPNRSEEAVKTTFNRFFGTMALYDLTRQWILEDGPFVCDFAWLPERYEQDRAEAWADDTFKQVYGVTLRDFKVVQ